MGAVLTGGAGLAPGPTLIRKVTSHRKWQEGSHLRAVPEGGGTANFARTPPLGRCGKTVFVLAAQKQSPPGSLRRRRHSLFPAPMPPPGEICDVTALGAEMGRIVTSLL